MELFRAILVRILSASSVTLLALAILTGPGARTSHATCNQVCSGNCPEQTNGVLCPGDCESCLSVRTLCTCAPNPDPKGTPICYCQAVS